MTEDPVRAENMHLRAELTGLQARFAALESEHAALQTAKQIAVARIEEIEGSTTWRLALRLVSAAETVPPQLRHSVMAGLRRLRGQALPAALLPAPPAPPPPPPAIPAHAKAFAIFTQSDADLARTPWLDPATPEISVIILNWNRAEMTCACVRYVLRHTRGATFEIIVADNGSQPADTAALQASGLPVRILRLGTNQFFGGANNYAAEQARGQYLFFLNNDAFVHDDWLAPLLAALRTVPDAGAAGSQLRFPDGRLQEAGGLVGPDGVANQLGKNADPADERYNAMRPVEYVSAAAMLIRRDDFLDLLGFELCYEPAYYEDVDLCMKLRARGRRVIYCPASVVTHVENVTSLDGRLSLRLENIIQANRFTFVSRWGDFLLGHPAPPAEAPPPYHPTRTGRPRVALHSPFMLTPGGGERYLLSIGQALAGVADVTLVTPFPCSVIRLRRLGLDLEVDVSTIALATLDEARSNPRFDAGFVMGNTVQPPVHGLARHNTYICQFPFPLLPGQGAGWDAHWAGYQRLLVYSGFAQDHLEARRIAAALPPLPVSVIPPPVRMRRPGPKARQILSVGRFFAGQHCKRQDMMVEAFRKLVADGTPCTLHLAGSLRPEPQHRAYYIEVVEAAKGLPISVHPNIGPAALDALFSGSLVYWHLTGLGTDLEQEPELSEHFGISLAEAMSAGCVPVAFRNGGPSEIIADGQDGILVDDLPGLVASTRALLEDPALCAAMASRAVTAAARYDEARFARAIQDLVTPNL